MSGKGKPMGSDSDADDDVVAVYVRVIRQDSAEAAAAIEKILTLCGSRAALRATLVITVLKMEFRARHSLYDIDIHNYLIRDFPEAAPLLDRALTYCLVAWDAAYEEKLEPSKSTPEHAD